VTAASCIFASAVVLLCPLLYRFCESLADFCEHKLESQLVDAADFCEHKLESQLVVASSYDLRFLLLLSS
jgi:hypothetical protein